MALATPSIHRTPFLRILLLCFSTGPWMLFMDFTGHPFWWLLWCCNLNVVILTRAVVHRFTACPPNSWEGRTAVLQRDSGLNVRMFCRQMAQNMLYQSTDKCGRMNLTGRLRTEAQATSPSQHKHLFARLGRLGGRWRWWWWWTSKRTHDLQWSTMHDS